MSVWANFANIFLFFLRGMRDRSMRGGTELLVFSVTPFKVDQNLKKKKIKTVQ